MRNSEIVDICEILRNFKNEKRDSCARRKTKGGKKKERNEKEEEHIT